VGVLAPRAQLELQGSAERRWHLEFQVVTYRHLSVALAPSLIFIEHANVFSHRSPISTLI
jgi:hypothetical protein